MNTTADVVVVGAGAIGSAIARELSKYQLDVVLLEKNEDIGGNASKANGGSVICGYDYQPGSLDGLLGVAANPMFDQLTKDLDVDFKRIGLIQVAMNEEDMKFLKDARQNAIANGVFDTELLTKEEVLKMEPTLSSNIVGGLYVPRQAIVDVFELVIAYVENARDNGVKVYTGTKAKGIHKEDGKVQGVYTDQGEIKTKFVVNAGGLFADEFAKTAGISDFENYPRKGEFYLLDKNLPYSPKRIIAPVPNALSRGKLLTPTVHGNILLGPTADNIQDKTDTSTTFEGLEVVLKEVREKVPAINPRDSVTQFSGLRPKRTPDEMVIRTVDGVYGYVEANGTSAGISISPAAAIYVVNVMEKAGLQLVRKQDFNPIRKGIKMFRDATPEEQDELIKKDPRYANIICRCETVSEAEILEAIRRGARSVDAIKRRLRAGMGRCQGGFCSPRVIEILSRELNIPPEEVRKNEPGSEFLIGENKKSVGEEE